MDYRIETRVQPEDLAVPTVKNTNSGSAKALRRAVQGGDIAELEALFAQGIHVNAKDEKGLTALLMIAAKRGDTAMVEVLLAHGADVNARDQGG